MTQTYMSRRREESAAPAQDEPRTTVPGPNLQELASGAAPSQEQMGRRVDLPEAIRARMEASFGADFSKVKLYESQTVADAGADAMAMGGAIGFAPGKLDLSSTAGQAMLGHELSHVVSQARGEVHGNGFLADDALEARADREGALAAAGESVYSGPVTPLSASAVPTATAGVAQASKAMDRQIKGYKKTRDAALKRAGNHVLAQRQVHMDYQNNLRGLMQSANLGDEKMLRDEIAANAGALYRSNYEKAQNQNALEMQPTPWGQWNTQVDSGENMEKNLRAAEDEGNGLFVDMIRKTLSEVPGSKDYFNFFNMGMRSAHRDLKLINEVKDAFEYNPSMMEALNIYKKEAFRGDTISDDKQSKNIMRPLGRQIADRVERMFPDNSGVPEKAEEMRKSLALPPLNPLDGIEPVQDEDQDSQAFLGLLKKKK